MAEPASPERKSSERRLPAGKIVRKPSAARNGENSGQPDFLEICALSVAQLETCALSNVAISR